MKKTDKNRKTGMKAAVLWAVFIFYLLFLVRVILFKQVRIDNLAAAFGSGLRSLNPIPFASIFEMLTSSGMSASRFIENVAGNLALFVPFGLMVPVLAELKANGKCMKEWERAPDGQKGGQWNEKKRYYLLTVLMGTALSLCFEAMQYIFQMGSSDIDDVLLNAAGVWIGCGICALLRRATRNRKISFEAAVLSVTVVLGIVGFIVIFICDSSLFLLSAKNVTVLNEQLVQEFIDKEEDARGSFVSFSAGKLTIEQIVGLEEGEEYAREASSSDGKEEDSEVISDAGAASSKGLSGTISDVRKEKSVFEVNDDSEIYVCRIYLECVFGTVVGERETYEKLRFEELMQDDCDVFSRSSHIRIWSRDGERADRILITEIE